MAKVAIVSDTHGYWDEVMDGYVADCDEIWHAGDFGNVAISDHLASLAVLRGVYGNIDNQALRRIHPENQIFEFEGVKVFMTHIGGYPPRYSPRVRRILAREMPDLHICGHSHIAKVIRDAERNLLHINPGAAGKTGFHHMRTMMRLEISGGKMSDLELIELGKRGSIG